jgi:hypothetical protein
VGIPLTVGFRQQLLVVSGLSVGIPLTVRFSPQLVVSALSVGIPLTVGFRLSRSPWLPRSLFTYFSFTRWNFGYHGALSYHEAFSQIILSHDGVLAITEPFHKFFLHTMEFQNHRAFSQTYFHMIEFWLSRSLLRTSLFHDGILAIKEPFTNSLFHNGILAIKEPFHESRWNSGYQGAFSRITVEFWLSRSFFTNHGGILAIKEPFHTIKFTKCTNCGESSFIYITKSIYTGSASLKTLPPNL